jgi:hypothetical protein
MATVLLRAKCSRIFLMGLGIAILALNGCGGKPRPARIEVHWGAAELAERGITSIAPQTAVALRRDSDAALLVGKVVQVALSDDQHIATVEIDPAWNHLVHRQATAVLMPAKDDAPARVDLVNAFPTGDAIEDGDQLIGSLPPKDSTLIGHIKRSWVLTSVAVLAGLLAVSLAVYLGGKFFRLVSFALCLAAGALSSTFLTSPVRDLIATVLSPEMATRIRPNEVSRIAAFLAGYILAIIILAVISQPLKKR